MTRVSNPSIGRGNTSVTTSVLGVVGSGLPRHRPITSIGRPPDLMPFSTPEWQCVIIFMRAVGETATDLNHSASFFHGAFFLNSVKSLSLHVYLASALSIGADVELEVFVVDVDVDALFVFVSMVVVMVMVVVDC